MGPEAEGLEAEGPKIEGLEAKGPEAECTTATREEAGLGLEQEVGKDKRASSIVCW